MVGTTTPLAIHSLRLAVVIPVYNRRDLVLETLASIQGQGVAPWQVVVVDDGSTDGSADAVDAWLATHSLGCPVVVVRQANAGVSAARNHGAKVAQGADLLAFLDSDDLWPPDLVEQALAVFAGNPALVAATADRRDVEIFSDGCQETHVPWPVRAGPVTATRLRKVFAYPCSTVFSARAFERAGGYPAGLQLGEDFVLAALVSTLGPWGRIASAPVSRRQFNHDASQKHPKTTHLSACKSPDVFRQFAQLLEERAQELGCLPPLRAAIAHRWRRAGKAMKAAGRLAEARGCYARALACSKWDLKARWHRWRLGGGGQ